MLLLLLMPVGLETMILEAQGQSTFVTIDTDNCEMDKNSILNSEKTRLAKIRKRQSETIVFEHSAC